MVRINFFSTEKGAEKYSKRVELIKLLVNSSSGSFSLEIFPAIISLAKNLQGPTGEYKFSVLEEKKVIFSQALVTAGISFVEIQPRVVLFVQNIPIEMSSEQLTEELKQQETSAVARIFQLKPGHTSKSGKILLDPVSWADSQSELKHVILRGSTFRIILPGFPTIFVRMWVDRGDTRKIRREKHDTTANLNVSSREIIPSTNVTYAQKTSQNITHQSTNLTNQNDKLSKIVAKIQNQVQSLEKRHQAFLGMQKTVTDIGVAVVGALEQVENLGLQVKTLNSKMDRILTVLQQNAVSLPPVQKSPTVKTPPPPPAQTPLPFLPPSPKQQQPKVNHSKAQSPFLRNRSRSYMNSSSPGELQPPPVLSPVLKGMITQKTRF